MRRYARSIGQQVIGPIACAGFAGIAFSPNGSATATLAACITFLTARLAVASWTKARISRARRTLAARRPPR